MTYYTYILSNQRNSVFYTGITNNIVRRTYEHRQGFAKGFTKKYKVKKLVYFEIYDDVGDAICREKLIKRWKRCLKINAIERMNPKWKDLYFDVI